MKKTITVFIISILMTMLLITTTLAASYSVKITLKDAVSDTFQHGQTITFVIKLADIEVEEGINSISGKFEYDTNVFEEIKAVDVEKCSGWESIAYTESGEKIGEFTVLRPEGETVSNDNDLMEIKAKIKENATLGSTKLKFSNLCANNGENEVKISDVSAKITISDSEGNINENNTTDIFNSIIGNNNTTTNNIMNNTVNTANNSTGNLNKIPDTGINDYFIPAIVLLTVVAFVSYIQYKKVKSI